MIYICETGCKYEGGSAFAATTHLPTAWRLIRERRIAGEADRRCGRRQVTKLKGWMWWEDDFDYYIIKRYVDAAHNDQHNRPASAGPG